MGRDLPLKQIDLLPKLLPCASKDQSATANQQKPALLPKPDANTKPHPLTQNQHPPTSKSISTEKEIGYLASTSVKQKVEVREQPKQPAPASLSRTNSASSASNLATALNAKPEQPKDTTQHAFMKKQQSRPLAQGNPASTGDIATASAGVQGAVASDRALDGQPRVRSGQSLVGSHTSTSGMHLSVGGYTAVASNPQRPSPIDLFEKLSKPKDVPWRSPVVTDEFYLLDLFYDGDETLGSSLLAHVKDKSMSMLSFSSLDSQESLALTNSFHRLSVNASRDGMEIRRDSKAHLSAELLEPSILKSASTSISNTALGRRPSVVDMAAPRMPKRPLPNLQQTATIHPFLASIPKFNSCTTLFTVDSTLLQADPGPKSLGPTLKAVAYAIMSHVDRTYTLYQEVSRFEAAQRVPAGAARLSSRIFRSNDHVSEKIHPIWNVRQIPDEVMSKPHIMQPPTVQEVYTFLKQIFRAANLSPQVAIISLIYLERMLLHTRIALQGVNLFWCILGALMLANKVWDDQAVWNADFNYIMPDLQLADSNALERWWLRQVNFDVNVKRGLYAKYWFGIREMAERLNGVKVGQVQMSIKAKSDMNVAGDGSGNGNIVSIHGLPGSQYLSVNPQQLPPGQSSHRRSAGILSSVPKPLTEVEMQRVSVSSNFSQSKLRESFAESLFFQAPTGAEESGNCQETTKSSNSDVSAQSPTKVTGFGWGGANLRRSKSDHLFTPVVPPASVL